MSVTDFRGDFANLSKTMQESWAQNREQPLLYKPEFLASYFSSPGANFHLAPAIYQDAELVAFAAGFPRSVSFGGRDLKLVLDSFVTVNRNYKGRGYGKTIWGALASRARDSGADGLLTFCVEGDLMNEVVVKISDQLGLSTRRIFSVPYMARPLRTSNAEATASPACDELSIFMAAAESVPATVPFARRWTAEEAKWQCRDRLGAVTAAASGDRNGIVTGYTIDASGAPATKCLIVEDLLWHALEPSKRQGLLRELLDRAALRGATLAVAPVLGYSDVQPLASSGFRRTRRMLHLYLTLWNGSLPAEEFPSIYVDVF